MGVKCLAMSVSENAKAIFIVKTRPTSLSLIVMDNAGLYIVVHKT